MEREHPRLAVTKPRLPLCAAEDCWKPASHQCPRCPSLNLPPTFYCSQDCFKASWKKHNQLHKKKMSFVPPYYAYTGSLRPAFVTEMRKVPDHIGKPDYAETGIPEMENKAKQSATIPIYTPRQIEGIRAACRLAREILDLGHMLVRPGITTEEIDRVLHDEIVSRNAYPSPLNYHSFPKACCTSVNEVICHGIPDCRPLEEGDIVNIDITVFYHGYHGDVNETFCVGEVDEESKRLIKASYDSLQNAIVRVKPGELVRNMGKFISQTVRPLGYSVVRAYCGHGIGELFHCAPNVPHYARNKALGAMKPGMIFTIEPMINSGHFAAKHWPDDWTAVTPDGKRSAQFEHTMLVTQNGVEVLTARTSKSPPLFWEEEGVQEEKKEEEEKCVEDVAAAGAEANEGEGKKKRKRKRKKKKKK